MSKSLRAAAATAFDAKEQEPLMEESQRASGEVHPGEARQSRHGHRHGRLGRILVKSLAIERFGAKPPGRTRGNRRRSWPNARTALSQAREKFQQAQRMFKARLRVAQLETAAKKAERTKRWQRGPRPETNLEGPQFHWRMVDYYLAQTYLDPDSPERTAALKKAAEAFDDVFQRDRELAQA